MTFERQLSTLAIILAGATGLAHATPLPTEIPTANVDIVPGFFGGTLLDTAITNISNASYNGIARAAVYDTGTGLDFYYQFSNDASSVNGLERFSAYNFSSVGSTTVLDVYQTAAPFGVFVTGTEPSDYADRTAFGVVGLSFVPNGASKINPGTTSYTQIIRTNARAYTGGNFGLLDGIGDNARGFSTTAVPEPSTSALMLTGLAACVFFIRRGRKTGH
ncbi:MAG TPA: PEP-CTERM sorting domain-containing protein [Aquabacterium sp.]|uniref:PEP-CTERM sorting domain-containing protein n=1 Tax=Aquabacterium sp. TaxID=1872578 RepID=UPI002E332943|nr:PEP-CTERM sorting domain-containing protein [Aquabacterium sp.]HEX5357164.1 PEP-CTERM sorting domain-containing protein [Aquabacterium sp.]